ncbi:hypothetical protein Q9L58_008091 [Maublancomyces gigas]|uniref:Ankyrin n=1 Tax=Discina gigas TaxID=1032678 RepID=A0ABR3GAP3_9PEZI
MAIPTRHGASTTSSTTTCVEASSLDAPASDIITRRPYVENRRPTSTRRPPPNTSPEILRPTPTEVIAGPAPKYVELEPLVPNPPDITEDTRPPHYQFDSTPVPLLFQAILDDDEEGLVRLLTQNPELVNERDTDGRTPLYLAVIAYDGRINIVKLLLEAGAEVDAWSSESQKITTKRWHNGAPEEPLRRTALMAASARNRLPITRLLLSPPYNADSALVAPDGQHALRLASMGRAREIVALLPSLRAGGWKRMQARSRPHILVIKKTGELMYQVGEVLVWHIPKFFVWTIPKYTGICFWEIIREMGKGTQKIVNYIWVEMMKLPGATKRLCIWLPGAVWGRIRKSPGALKRFAAKLWEGIKDFVKWIWDAITVQLPKATVKVAKFLVGMVKWVWKFLTVYLPKFTVGAAKFFWKIIAAIAGWVWDIITVRVPKVSVMVYHAIIDALGKSWEWFVSILESLASLLHTFVSFILRKCTLSNLVQATKQTLHFFFVSVPKTIWAGIRGIYKLCYEVVKGLFGCIGWFFWGLCECLVATVLWFPAMMGKILLNCAKILGGVWKEFRLWLDPKADV